MRVQVKITTKEKENRVSTRSGQATPALAATTVIRPHHVVLVRHLFVLVLQQPSQVRLEVRRVHFGERVNVLVPKLYRNLFWVICLREKWGFFVMQMRL
jgi:hypothetical protein